MAEILGRFERLGGGPIMPPELQRRSDRRTRAYIHWRKNPTAAAFRWLCAWDAVYHEAIRKAAQVTEEKGKEKLGE